MILTSPGRWTGWSPSQVSTHEACNSQWWLETIAKLRIPSPESREASMAVGTWVHALNEAWCVKGDRPEVLGEACAKALEAGQPLPKVSEDRAYACLQEALEGHRSLPRSTIPSVIRRAVATAIRRRRWNTRRRSDRISLYRPGGGIGRHTSLRGWHRKA